MLGRHAAAFLSCEWLRAILLLASFLCVTAPSALLAQSEPRPGAAEGDVADARKHFELGVAHFDRKEWQAALAEFLRSRELARTRANTKNAAICLRKVGRFDEALDLFEALLRDFPDLPPADVELARREISDLRASVGTLEIHDAPPGAHVTIDGVERGVTPLTPLRLSAGTHIIRVVKEDSLPFEARVDLAGGQVEVLRVRLAALTQAGRLRVSEKSGRPMDVIVDGSRVGTTPWDGALAPGVHSVALRGDGMLGVPPTRVAVAVDEATVLELTARALDAGLSVGARPGAAQIFVDGALAGRGSWKGRVGAGPHRLDVVLATYEPFSQEVSVSSAEERYVPVVLEPLVRKTRIELELEAGIPLGLVWGGDLQNGCTPPCSASLPVGVYVQAHAIYRFPVGVGVGVYAGYLRMWTTLAPREESLSVTGPPLPQRGTVEDHLRLAGLLAGGEADYVIGKTWPLTLRLSAGALIGAVTDTRTGTFTDSAGSSYVVAVEQTPRASYLSLGPEVRVGYRASAHFDASVGAKLFVLTALTRPSWDGDALVYAGENDRGGYFPSATLTGDILLAALLSVAVRYAF